MVGDSSLQKLRLKYYRQGITLYDIVSLVGNSNVVHAKHAMRRSLKNESGKFYYVSRQSISNGTMDCLATPVMYDCGSLYLDAYLLDGRCIVISGDTTQFKAMLIKDGTNFPVVLGRESFAIRFNSPEDALSAHAWFLSDEVSSAIRSTLREKALVMNKSSMRMTVAEFMTLPVPSIEWLNDNYSHGILKAKCIGLGSHIVSSLQGGDINDPMYRDIVGVLETAVKQIVGVPSTMLGDMVDRE